MENNENIDKKFNDASRNAEEPLTFPGFEQVWGKVEEKLDTQKDKKRVLPLWLPYGIAASLVLGIGSYYFLNKNTDVIPTEKVIVKTEISNSEQGNAITKIDSLSQIKIAQQKQEIISSTPAIASQEPSFKSNPITPTPLKAPKVIVSNNIKNEYLEPNYEGILHDEEKAIEPLNDVEVVGLRDKRKYNYTVNRGELPVSIAKNQDYSAIKGEKSIVITGAMGIKKKNDALASANVYQSLQGKVAGLTISPSPKFERTSNSEIKIRGNNSLSGNNDVLYVVNGKISHFEVMKTLDPDKIESMQVLKGAQATSLYGSDGSNGVVLIKTKKLSKKEKKRIKEIEDLIKQNPQSTTFSNNEEYEAFVENPFELTQNQSVSTFSIDVDNAAYSNIRRMINNGQKVNKNAVRIEEMINYFKYNYPQPTDHKPFSINTEYNEAPWNKNHKLLKIGLQGEIISPKELPKSNLVFLIDVSGSMNAANKLPLLKNAFKVLLDQLSPNDKVGIVVYASNAGVVLPSTEVKNKEKILEVLSNLQANGSTAGGEGIEAAYKMATENFIKNGNNRVIIATDGDFNVGASTTSDLQTLIEEKRKSGVFLTCLGFGMGNFKDNTMETLANKGNGNYAYIDSQQEAIKVLGKEFMGNLFTLAKDVKIQIEFNPKFVKSYRLIGYENRKLKNEDFSNDKVDAGELGVGHTVTALYEIIPVNIPSEFLPKEIEKKYTNSTFSNSYGDELATIKFRYKEPNGEVSKELVEIIKNSNSKLEQSSSDFKFASSVAWFGLVLRDSDLIKNKNWEDIIRLAEKGKANDEQGYRSEFIRLVEANKINNK